MSRLALLAFVLASLAGGATPARPDREPPSVSQPVNADGLFLNLDGSMPQTPAAVLRWALWERMTGQRRNSPRRAPVPQVEPDLALLARPPAPGEPARLTWLGHASWLVQLDGVSLLVDPALKPILFGGIDRNAGPGLTIEQLPPIDAQLVTHSHYDHLDLPTLTAVKAPVIAGLGLERLFRAEKLFCTELGWWGAARHRVRSPP